MQKKNSKKFKKHFQINYGRQYYTGEIAVIVNFRK